MKDGLAVELELRAEKASSLAVAAEKLERVLVELAEARRALETASEEQRPALLAAFEETRAQAGERLWFFLVQREAMGVTQHEPVLAYYRVPADVRVRAGAIRRRLPAAGAGTSPRGG
jgi:hypothetical protein